MKKKVQRLFGAVMVVCMMATMIPAAMAASDYENHWAKDTIQTFIDNDWLLGYGDGQYGPNDALTYEQYATLLNRLGGTELDTIASADVLTREQAMVMVANVLGLTANETQVELLARFSDADEISDDRKNGVAAMVAAGYINGTPAGLLMPQSQLTRAEGITILNNAIQALTFDPADYDVVYGTATLTFAEYYSGDVSSTDSYGVDGISSATVGMYNSFNSGMYTNFTPDKTEGYNILGVKNVNVAVAAEDYEAYVAINPTFRISSTTPNQYKTVTIENGKAVYSATNFNVVATVSDAVAELQTGSNWGDYQINVTETSTANIRNNRSDEGWAINANIQGTILETESGLKVGMEFLQSMWLQPWEVSFNVTEDSAQNAHIAGWDNLPELAKLVGEKVTSITYIMPDSTYVYTFDGIYIKPAYAGTETVRASFEEGSAEVAITGVPEALEDVTVTVIYGSGRQKVTVASAAQIVDGKVTMDSAYDSTQTYTVTVASSNYADIVAALPLSATQREQLTALVEQAKTLIDNGTAANDAALIEHCDEAVEMLTDSEATSAEAAELITDLTGHVSVYTTTEESSSGTRGH